MAEYLLEKWTLLTVQEYTCGFHSCHLLDSTSWLT